MNQRHGRHVFWEGWEEADSGDRLQATKYAEEIIFSDKSAVRWTNLGWEIVYADISETEADLFMHQQIEVPLPVSAEVEAFMPAPFEIAPIDPISAAASPC